MVGTVYILTNPAMPGLVKVGRTNNLGQRVRQLSQHAGVPVAFEIHYARRVEEAERVERGIHLGFADHRISDRREFFEINPERIVAVLEIIPGTEIDPSSEPVNNEPPSNRPSENESVDEGDDEPVGVSDEIVHSQRLEERRSIFRFSLAKILKGAELHFVRDDRIVATVHDDRNIMFEGDVVSLSQATLTVMSRNYGSKRIAVQGTLFWVYEGETLDERRRRIEEQDSDDDDWLVAVKDTSD